ncbi:hypothetical protein LP7551_01448 [Roseibium album]|nr:hypothetical protein LP7551_01448 [Roseibium album]
MRIAVAFLATVLMTTNFASACITTTIPGRIDLLVFAEVVVVGKAVGCKDVNLRSGAANIPGLEVSFSVSEQIYGDISPVASKGVITVIFPEQREAESTWCRKDRDLGGLYLLGLDVWDPNRDRLLHIQKFSVLDDNLLPKPPLLASSDKLMISQPTPCEFGMSFKASKILISDTKLVFDGVGDLNLERKGLQKAFLREALGGLE